MIGVGAMGRNHVRVLSEADSVKLVAIADTNRPLAHKTAEQYRVKAYDDYRLMIENEQLEAVSIVVPTTLHRQISVDATSKGIHVLLEKPIAATVEHGARDHRLCSSQ